MAEKQHLTLDKAKQVIEDYLMFASLSIGRLILVDFSESSSKEIIDFAESLPQELINYSNTLDKLEEKMAKNIDKIQKELKGD